MVEVSQIELRCRNVFGVDGIGLPVCLGGSEVECLLVGLGAKSVELRIGGVLGNQRGDLGASLGRWSRVQGTQTRKIHQAIERRLNRGVADDLLHPCGKIGMSLYDAQSDDGGGRRGKE